MGFHLALRGGDRLHCGNTSSPRGGVYKKSVTSRPGTGPIVPHEIPRFSKWGFILRNTDFSENYSTSRKTVSERRKSPGAWPSSSLWTGPLARLRTRHLRLGQASLLLISRSRYLRQMSEAGRALPRARRPPGTSNRSARCWTDLDMIEAAFPLGDCFGRHSRALWADVGVEESLFL
jgi:hypothetical protein